MPGIARQCSEGLPQPDPAAAPRRAAFLDRDGTIISDARYLSSPDQLRLISGAAEAIVALNRAGVPVVVVTNQSGIARGYFSRDEYCKVERALDAMLRDAGAILQGSYFCPHLPELTGGCGCRKPGTALFRLAAARHGLALEGSLYVGDRWRDVAPALALGGTGILVPAPDTAQTDRDTAARRARVASSLGEAIRLFLDDIG